MAKYFIWPVPGFYRVSSGFRTAERPNHVGIDIGRNVDPPRSIEGACIVAVADGRVSGWGMLHESMGNWISIDHGEGWSTRYLHNQLNLVAKGEYVRQGDVIGLVGNTGRSYGPHLHFEITRNCLHLNPADLLTKVWKLPKLPLLPGCAGDELPPADGAQPVPALYGDVVVLGMPRAPGVWSRLLAWFGWFFR